ncbi:MAG: TadE family protein [Candidatus Limnocylindria bacterium]
METALVMTIVVMVLLLTIDLGRAYFTFVGLRNAAREAAIYGGYNPTETCASGSTFQGLTYEVAKEMRLGEPPDPSRVGCGSGGDAWIDTGTSGCHLFTSPSTFTACTAPPFDPQLTYVYRLRLEGNFQPVTPFVGLLTGNGFGGAVPMAVLTSAPVLSEYGS